MNQAKGKALIDLGRVSNLPTVWTNCLAALALVGGHPAWERVLGCGVALSLMYTGGMYLNDAFDRKIDAIERPERPIPAGVFSASAVFFMGFFQLFLGVLGVALLELSERSSVGAATWSSLLLAGFVVLYDSHHKGNPLSPLIMGMCRVTVYTTAGLLFFSSIATDGGTSLLSAPELLRLAGGATLLLLYLIGLTFVAKREGRGIAPPLPISTLIAGICLIDGAFMLIMGRFELAPLGLLGFLLTKRLQRWVSGT